ncbi:J domain-containing protein [Oleomonas cavernae]|uniref:J domain-containing protein n=1 Tax=Oleomonas cavernae TaxID=2320859 RepID=UPI0011C4377C|nr:hypothetical protein [Oleomonas cavernae]
MTATCQACGAAVDDAICAACNALQPPGQLDHFARLGLPRDFALSEKTLERAYFAAQRRFHPDRFASRGRRKRPCRCSTRP